MAGHSAFELWDRFWAGKPKGSAWGSKTFQGFYLAELRMTRGEGLHGLVLHGFLVLASHL